MLFKHRETRGYSFCVSLVLVVLFVVAAVYHVKGYYYLVVRVAVPVDLRARWEEQRCIRDGTTHAFNTEDRAVRSAMARHIARSDYEIPLATVQLPSRGGYAPWAFFFGNMLFWPDWPDVRNYFAIVNLVATAVIAWWSFTLLPTPSVKLRLLLVAAVLAVNGFCRSLVLGQYGIVCTAFLVIACELVSMPSRLDRTSSGIAMGIAMSKPSLAFPFILPLLARRKWGALLGLLSYLVIATTAVWYATAAPPWEMIAGMLQSGTYAAHRGSGILPRMINQGFDNWLAALSVALITLATGALLMHRFAKRRSLILFALAAVIGRLWTYHHNNDNVILVFLLVALAFVAVSQNSRAAACAFVLTGITLWVPPTITNLPGIDVFQIAVWISSALILVIVAESNANSGADLDRSAVLTRAGSANVTHYLEDE